MTTPKKPADRQPAKDAPFRFKGADGKSYTLPRPTEEAAMRVPGEITYAVVMRPDDPMAEMRLAFATLEAVKPSAAAMAAFKALPTEEMLRVAGEWMGESGGSSV